MNKKNFVTILMSLIIWCNCLGCCENEYKKELLDIISKLNHELFSVREEGSLDLSLLPASFFYAIKSIYLDYDDREIKERLEVGAKTIFYSKILRKIREWNIGRGHLGIYGNISLNPIGIRINYIDEDIETESEHIYEGDIIIGIGDKIFKKELSLERANEIFSELIPGEKISLKINRSDEIIAINVFVREIVSDYLEETVDPEIYEEQANNLWKLFWDKNLPIKELQTWNKILEDETENEEKTQENNANNFSCEQYSRLKI